MTRTNEKKTSTSSKKTAKMTKTPSQVRIEGTKRLIVMLKTELELSLKNELYNLMGRTARGRTMLQNYGIVDLEIKKLTQLIRSDEPDDEFYYDEMSTSDNQDNESGGEEEEDLATIQTVNSDVITHMDSETKDLVRKFDSFVQDPELSECVTQVIAQLEVVVDLYLKRIAYKIATPRNARQKQDHNDNEAILDAEKDFTELITWLKEIRSTWSKSNDVEIAQLLVSQKIMPVYDKKSKEVLEYVEKLKTGEVEGVRLRTGTAKHPIARFADNIVKLSVRYRDDQENLMTLAEGEMVSRQKRQKYKVRWQKQKREAARTNNLKRPPQPSDPQVSVIVSTSNLKHPPQPSDPQVSGIVSTSNLKQPPQPSDPQATSIVSTSNLKRPPQPSDPQATGIVSTSNLKRPPQPPDQQVVGVVSTTWNTVTLFLTKKSQEDVDMSTKKWAIVEMHMDMTGKIHITIGPRDDSAQDPFLAFGLTDQAIQLKQRQNGSYTSKVLFNPTCPTNSARPNKFTHGLMFLTVTDAKDFSRRWTDATDEYSRRGVPETPITEYRPTRLFNEDRGEIEEGKPLRKVKSVTFNFPDAGNTLGKEAPSSIETTPQTTSTHLAKVNPETINSPENALGKVSPSSIETTPQTTSTHLAEVNPGTSNSPEAGDALGKESPASIVSVSGGKSPETTPQTAFTPLAQVSPGTTNSAYTTPAAGGGDDGDDYDDYFLMLATQAKTKGRSILAKGQITNSKKEKLEKAADERKKAADERNKAADERNTAADLEEQAAELLAGADTQFDELQAAGDELLEAYKKTPKKMRPLMKSAFEDVQKSAVKLSRAYGIDPIEEEEEGGD